MRKLTRNEISEVLDIVSSERTSPRRKNLKAKGDKLNYNRPGLLRERNLVSHSPARTQSLAV